MAETERDAAIPNWLMSGRLATLSFLLAFGLALSALAKPNPLQPLDDFLHSIFLLHDSPRVTWFARWVLSAPGHIETALLMGVVSCIILARVGQGRHLLPLISSLLLAAICAKTLKSLVGRLRPETASGMTSLAWPSGHTMLATVLWGVLLFIFLRRWVESSSAPDWASRLSQPHITTRLWLLLLSITALARMVAGVHWFTDVLGGALIGILLLQLGLLLDARLAVTAVHTVGSSSSVRTDT